MLEEEVWGFERSREIDDTSRAFCDPLEGGDDSGGRRSPHQEDCIDVSQALIQGIRQSEITLHDLNVWREMGSIGVANHSADF